MTSEIRSNIIKNRVGLGTVSFTDSGPVVSGIVTSNTLRLPNATSGSLGRLQLGNGLHFSMYHDGSNSFLVNNNGYLSIQSQAGVNGIFIARNAEVNLYYGPSVRLQTSSSGVTINRDIDVDGHTNLDNVSVAGVSTFSNSVKFVGTTSGRDLNWDYGSNKLNLADNVLLGLGNSDDLLIHHTGSTGYIKGQNGNLYIQSDQVVVIGNQSSSSAGLKFTNGGAAELYHNNVKKFETTSAGSKISGNLELSSTYPSLVWTDTNHNSDFRITNDDGKLIVYDTTRGAHVMDFLANGDVRIRNDKGLYFGEGNDLLIGHDGSSTRIEDSYGYLGIKSNALDLRSYTGSELYAKFVVNGAAELYHNNAKKFETLSSGVQVTGTFAELIFNCLNGTGKQYKFRASGTNSTGFELFDITLNQRAYLYHDSTYLGGVHHFHTNGTLRFAIEGPHVNIANDTSRLRIGASADLQLWHDGSHSYIDDSGTGNLYIQSNHVNIDSKNGEEFINCIQDGAVELYYDNVIRFKTTSTGIQVAEGSADINIRSGTPSNAGHGYITFENVDGNGQPRDVVRLQGYSTGNGGYGELRLQTAFNNTLSTRLAIHNTGNSTFYGDVELTSTDSGSAAAPTLKLQRDSSSPANQDVLGQIVFGGKDSTPNDENYASVAGKIIQAGAGGEHGAIQITTRKASSNVITANLTSTDYELLNGTNLSVDGDITGNGNFQLTSTDTGSAAAPELTLLRNSTSPADADYLGQIKFVGKHDAGSSVNYAKITGKILDASQGTEDGILEFMLRKAGSNNIAGRFRSDKLQLINGTGLEVAGQTTFSDHVSIPDDKELTIGDSADLKLSHSTSLSSISSNNVNNFTIRQSAGSGFMFIHADQLHLRSQSTNEPYLVATNNGPVTLYYDNVSSLVTTSEGIAVQKTASNISSMVSIEATNGGQAKLELKTSKSGTNRAARIDYYNQDSTQPKWTLINDYNQNGNNEFSIRYANSQKIAINCTQNNMVDLYHNNNLCLRTASDGLDVWAGSTSQHANIRIRPTGTAVYSTILFFNSSGGQEGSIGTHSGADTMYYVCPNHLFHIGGAYKIQMTGSTLQPYSGASVDLGSTGSRWNNIYTNDLNLSNEGKTNDVDGTWGSYTIQEGEDDLFLINKRSGKKYKFNLTEVS